MSIVEYPFPDMEELEGLAYCIFPAELESDGLVLFHITQERNMGPIVAEGFKSAATLGVKDGLASVSYAYKSSGTLMHKKNECESYVVLAVRFTSLDTDGIRKNHSDIHVDNSNIQPEVIGFCRLPSSRIY